MAAALGPGRAVEAGGSTLATCYEVTVVPALELDIDGSRTLIGLSESGRLLIDVEEVSLDDVSVLATVWTGAEAHPIVVDGLVDTFSQGINERGEVLVFGDRGADSSQSRAVLWQDGAVLAEVSVPEHSFHRGWLNELGHAALQTIAIYANEGVFYRAWRWRDGELAALDDSDLEILAFDDYDGVYGFDRDAREFVRWGGARTVLPTGCRPESEDYSLYVSDSGRHVVGSFRCGDTWHAVHWTGGQVRELEHPAGEIRVRGVNDDDHIIGSRRGGQGEWIPVQWSSDLELAEIPSLGHDGAYFDINNHGLMIGRYYDESGGEIHAYQISDGHYVVALPYPPGADFGHDAYDVGPPLVNDRGDLVADTQDADWAHRALSWRPAPSCGAHDRTGSRE
ncbi:hypothetical protein [Nannocystis bainbridge]|uniref:Uncharacterized protein n=1 Tax=Nannocystis bainbridge TaxID=2995303 RepID=A0ABT5DRA7_9BACT|nr:hypothetical protein [Nannocystis bainbridge]MDC0716182.1 hypothetical protein [Nannocystis bainbridge]